MTEIEFPQSVCINSQPHGPHRIAGTWRTECPGYTPPPVPDRSPAALALDAVDEVWRTINAPNGFRPVDVRPLLDRIEQALRDSQSQRSEPFYTPAAGDADQYNEWGQPRGYVHPSAG